MGVAGLIPRLFHSIIMSKSYVNTSQGPILCCSPLDSLPAPAKHCYRPKGHFKAARAEAKDSFLKRNTAPSAVETNWASGRRFAGRKLLVLDMDETLVHATAPAEGDYRLKVAEGFEIGLRLRPFVRDFLAKMSQIYEIAVFTSSQQAYADTVLNFLDPEDCLIHHRLYRQHCTFHTGTAYKDLTVFTGVDLRDIVICDNLISNFALQLENGVPVKTWTDAKEDKELVLLCQYLVRLAGVKDVREVNRETFKLSLRLSTHCNSPL